MALYDIERKRTYCQIQGREPPELREAHRLAEPAETPKTDAVGHRVTQQTTPGERR